MTMQVPYTVEVKEQQASRLRRSDQTKQPAEHTEHIDKVMCLLCYTARFQQSKPSRKTLGSYQVAKHRQSCRQLCERAEVSADGAENRRRSTSYTKTTSSLTCQLRCMSKPSEHPSPIFVFQGASDTRGIGNCGSSLKE